MSLLLVLLFVCVSSKNLPPEVQKCSISDPNLARCLEKAIPDFVKKFPSGNKDISLTSIEPFEVAKIEIGNSTIHQTYENLKFHGVSEATLSDMTVDFSDDHCKWSFDMFFKRIHMESDYKMTGRLLVFPINGHGKATLTIYNVPSKYDIKCEIYVKNKKKHMRVVQIRSEMHPEKVEVSLENIIDGNEQLSKEVVETLNENSKVLWEEMWPVVGGTMEKVWKESVNRFFEKVSLEEMFLP